MSSSSRAAEQQSSRTARQPRLSSPAALLPHGPAAQRGRRASTLLLALIILGGLVATSLTVGTIVVTRLRGVKAIDDSVLASYAAESGVEELLYDVRKREQRAGLNVSNRALPNGASWTRTVETTSNEIFIDLKDNDTQQLDLFNPSGDLTDVVDIRTLLLAAANPSPDAWLEVSWVPWMLGTDVWSPVTGRVLFSPTELQGQKTVDLMSPPFGGTPVAYRVRLRNVSGTVGRVRITAASDVGGLIAVAFPSRIRATVVGTMGSAQYATRVEFPTSFPLAPVFDYVLFSECDIVKGGTIGCPPGN